MNDFNQDMQNLLNAYDSNWEDYLILREQFIEKYSLSVDKLEDHLLPYSKEMVQKIRDEKMQLVTVDEFVKLHKESLTAIRENDKLQEQLNTAKKALTEIYLDVNETIIDPVFLFHQSQRIAERALKELGENNEI